MSQADFARDLMRRIDAAIRGGAAVSIDVTDHPQLGARVRFGAEGAGCFFT
ncbi:MAG: hypothetical protein JSS35_14405, partial [Proteobacteria bacterium]|nr:hypothetical protein [Pseudomonadota bacterium]